MQFVKRRCSSTSPLRGFISCSYPGLKAGWSLTGGVQLRKLSWECSSEIVLTIPACWKMCLGPGGLGIPVYFFRASQSCLVDTKQRMCLFEIHNLSGSCIKKFNVHQWSETQKDSSLILSLPHWTCSGRQRRHYWEMLDHAKFFFQRSKVAS